MADSGCVCYGSPGSAVCGVQLCIEDHWKECTMRAQLSPRMCTESHVRACIENKLCTKMHKIHIASTVQRQERPQAIKHRFSAHTLPPICASLHFSAKAMLHNGILPHMCILNAHLDVFIDIWHMLNCSLMISVSHLEHGIMIQRRHLTSVTTDCVHWSWC